MFDRVKYNDRLELKHRARLDVLDGRMGAQSPDLAIFSTMKHSKCADYEKNCKNLIILCKMD